MDTNVYREYTFMYTLYTFALSGLEKVIELCTCGSIDGVVNGSNLAPPKDTHSIVSPKRANCPT